VPQTVVDHFGSLDIIVHSAAYTANVPGWAVPFSEQSLEPWDRAVRINTTSAFLLVQAAQQHLEQSEHGSVVFVSSIYGLVGPDMRLYEGTGMNNAAGYAATKGGLLQLMRYLSTVLAPRVRVNAVSPGGIWRNQPSEFHERYKARTPLGRMASEEDLKGAIAYLGSDLSNYVTGHNLVVDGGWTAW
jgi:NAD(P)-dependent dehydrogenase (short-subunit alcohol dehydrogenase family)